MPRDTGSVTKDLRAGQESEDAGQVTSPVEALVLSYGAHLGEGLRAARESRRMTIQDVSDVTRIHPRVLEALEALDMSRLPSRPFAIGFVRSYARLLGIDEDKAVERFKADAPDANEPFRAPVGGVSEGGDPRLALVVVAAILVVGAIIVWNVAQRAMADRDDDRPTVPVVQSAPAPKPQDGPVALGPALPAPVESTVPKPYVTPGLGAPDSTNAITGDPTRPVTATETLPELRASNPNAPVFGAPADQSLISLRARKSVALVVKSPNGAIFTRVLAAGETYRAPMAAGIVFEISDPTGVDVFHQGQFIGQLRDRLTPASKLGG